MTTYKITSIRFMLFLVGVVATMLLLPAVTSAAPVDVLPACGGAESNVVCQGGAGTDTSVYGLLKNVINLLLTVIGIIAVITIIVAGIRYVTSGGDGPQTKSARDTILYAVVGLVVAVLAFAIVNFVLDNINR